MKIVQVQGIFSPEHGGPTHSLRNYCVSLAKRNHEVTALVLDGWPNMSPVDAMPAPVKTISCRVQKPYALGASAEMKGRLSKLEAVDLFHLHGAWLRAMHYGAVEARARKIPYVFELMGMYEEYSLGQKWFKKRVSRAWFQDKNISLAGCLHVNSESEGIRLRKMGFKPPIAVIPVGVDTDLIRSRQTNSLEMDVPEIWKLTPFFLFLSRIHPKKGIEMLLPAWAKLHASYPDVRLVIAGAGEASYVQRLQEMASNLGIFERCVWAGAVSENQKAWLLTKAKFMALPTYSENFGNVVPEALAHGTPVLTTTGTPWSGIVVNRCGWYVAPSTEAIEQGLRTAMATPDDELKQMGQAGRNWCEENFSLNYTADSIDSVYRWLVNGDAKPSCLID